ncbi:membrane protein insertase YidC [Rhizosphaericola mali]|uniref:Membrane protein insertase YidC n=1 Tax=Rhizosphaericola mali TaxID=2545455 RepID=A0A5P2FXB4_9BACT|nr:membrane protein insertase YidC [Rhizosphaericola mali]QES87835.1 membrane protein insertase YidC [Rhizosphaericola mali]
MKRDKMSIAGFVLLGVLFIAFFWVTNKQQMEVQKQEKQKQDSIAKAEKAKIKPLSTADSLKLDSLTRNQIAGSFTSAAAGKETEIIVENDLMKAVFSNKGGQLKSVSLKKYDSYDKTNTPVIIGGGNNDQMGYAINTSNNTTAQTSDLYFTADPIVKNADGSQSLTFTLFSPNGEKIVHQYLIRPDQYMINWNIGLTGANHLLTGNTLNFHWNTQLHQQQRSASYEKQQSRIVFYSDNDFDYDRAKEKGNVTKDFEKPVEWLGFKQQFFNATVALSKNSFSKGKATMDAFADTTGQLFDASANMQLSVPATATASIPMQIYFGPNDYGILKQYDNGMKNIVDLGSGMFSFVKYINRGIIIPVFNFLAGFITNFGWVIALLTLFIRIILSPLTYSSYLSGAKMKVLKPELDELKKKYGKDQQGFAMEQMKLFREAGVNPMGGCIPVLFQIPIFFSLYSFFSSNIQLRGKSFLWAHDLSAYDSIISWHTNIPVIGDHLSLFTFLSAITSLLISVYNISATPQTQDNPALKYMPYIMPIVFLFWWNNMPSALTWYYTVSNVVTLLIQLFIQKVVINPQKVLALIEEKRKAPKKGKGKFAQRLEQMAEMQKQMQDAKNRGKK